MTITPLLADEWEGLQLIYETLPGWRKSTFGVTEYHQLPKAALVYLQRIEELTSIPIEIISTGPDRDETIILLDPFDV